MNTFSYYILVDSNHFHFRKKNFFFQTGNYFCWWLSWAMRKRMGFVKRGKLRINEDVDMMMLQFCPIVCLTESCPWKMMDCPRCTLDGGHVRDPSLSQVYVVCSSHFSPRASILNYAETTVLQDWIMPLFLHSSFLGWKSGTQFMLLLLPDGRFEAPWAFFEKRFS